jgi:uncharacterized protein (TIGR00661 family)
MKILYAIQGTGNGHISRARDIIPELKKYGKVDILVSGIQADVSPGFEIDYRLNGMGFIFGKKGNVDLVSTFRKCVTRQFLREIKEFPVMQYDLVVNDFEPVSAWAARKAGVPCVSLSHQFAVLQPDSPRPEKKDWIGKMVLSNYAPVQAGYGFHFRQYAGNIFKPVIRQQVRDLDPVAGDYITVYLPSYDNERIIKVLSNIKSEDWHVFSKHTTREFRVGNLWIRPIQNEMFLKSMASGKAVLCGAGFETPAEAMFLQKNLMVIPMKNQYEQQCNAAALSEMGVPMLKSLKRKHLPLIENWLLNGKPVPVDYPNETGMVVEKLMSDFFNNKKEEVEFPFFMESEILAGN